MSPNSFVIIAMHSEQFWVQPSHVHISDSPTFPVDFKLMTQALPENWLNKGSKPDVMLYLSYQRKKPWRTWRMPFLWIKNSQSCTLLCNKYIFTQLGYRFHTYTHGPLPDPHKQWPTFYSFLDYSENSQFDNPAVLCLCLLVPVVTRNCWLQYFFLRLSLLFYPVSVIKRTEHAQCSSGCQY